MLNFRKIILVSILLPLLSWASTPESKGGEISNLLLPLKTSVYEGPNITFNHRPYLGFGIRNFMLDYSGTVQFKNWAELGVGIGYHSNSAKFYSASDKHTVRVNSLPTYITAIIYPYHDNNRAFYVKGNYGIPNNFSGAKNQNDGSIAARMFQGGIGYKHYDYNSNRSWYVELSQYSTMAKGSYKDLDTYNATIDYNLQFYGIVVAIGVNLNGG
ncbi:MAG: hypothetical protein N4A35_11045 [Flavobacteriales bacterium]|jgi:hypothetical protein|nr:hypothetical protein [Flavobacteriales bacterium]